MSDDGRILGLEFVEPASARSGPPPKSRVREWLAVSVLLIYGAGVLLATMWPTPLDQGFKASIDRLLDVLHRNGVPGRIGYNEVEFAANVAMFAPLGFLVAMLLAPRVWWLSLVICPALSVAIEITQGALLAERFATANDVISNSAGALIGAFIAMAIRAAVHDRDSKVVARALWVEKNARAGSR